MRFVLQVTETAESGLNTGIQRVVKRLAAEFSRSSAKMGIDVSLVVALRSDRSKCTEITIEELLGENTNESNPNLVFQNPTYSALARLWNLCNVGIFSRILNSASALKAAEQIIRLIHRRQIKATLNERFSFNEDDVFIILDSFWGNQDGLALAKAAKRNGARVAVLINDIVPITRPEFCESHIVSKFEKSLRVALELADYLMYPSLVTRDEISEYFFNGTIPIKHKLLKYGADVSSAENDSENTTQRVPNSILMIGTLEPRKNYNQVFDWYLAKGRFNTHLTIIGKPGWHTEKIQAKMRLEAANNPLFRWLDSATDDELLFEMGRHEIGLMASHAEGLGLPVIEMRKKGLKLVLSDIPIFREIAGGGADFFSLGSLESLSAAIENSKKQKTAAPADVGTWAECSDQLFDFLGSDDA